MSTVDTPDDSTIEDDLDVAELSVAKLGDLLLAQAHGDYATEAAARLLIDHEMWLCRSDFRGYLAMWSDGWDGYQEVPMVAIAWREILADLDAGQLHASTSEANVLRVAASLAGSGTVQLRKAMSGLDATNSRLVIAAITHYATCGGTR